MTTNWKFDDFILGYKGKTIQLLSLSELQALKLSNPDEQLISVMGTIELAKNADEDVRGNNITAFGKLSSLK